MMEFTKTPGFGERFAFPENVEITINGDTISTIREAAVRMAERWEESVVGEIVNEARLAGYTEVTVLNKEVILEALSRYVMPPKTNADRIRAMSDRELAAFLAGKFTDHETEKAVQKGEVLTATYVREMAHTWFRVWMQWLRQPAEVDNGV